MLSRAKRTPIKHSVALRAVCAAHTVTVEGSNLMVCQGRKVVYVLRVGVIHSKNCIVKEAPTPSFRRDSGVGEAGWKTVVVPNGWKVAVIVDNDVWTAEIGYSEERDLAQYQFTRLDEEGKILVQSDWCFTPSGAFKSASAEFIGDESAWGRHNGKLYLGCTYDYPQVFLRQHFKKKLDSGDHNWDSITKTIVAEWLDPAKQSSKAIHNAQHGLGPVFYAARGNGLESAEDVEEKPLIDSPSATASPPLQLLEQGDLEAKRIKYTAAKVARRGPRATPNRRGLKPAPEENPAPEIRPPSDPATRKLELVTSNWIAQAWNDITQEMYQSEAKLKRIFPGTPDYPSTEAQARAMSCISGTLFNEEEILAIVYHVDGQIQRILLDKQMMLNVGASAAARTMANVVGYIPKGAIKNIMDIIPTAKKSPDGLNVSIDDFLNTLSSIEVCAVSLFPILSQTLFLFPVDDIFKRLEEEEKPGMTKTSLGFIRTRMKKLDVDSKDNFRMFANASEFIRALTFLPRASLVQKFMNALLFNAPALPAPQPTMMPMTTGASSFQGVPGNGMITGSWMPLRQGMPQFNMPIMMNPFRQGAATWVTTPDMQMQAAPNLAAWLRSPGQQIPAQSSSNQTPSKQPPSS